MPPTHAARNRQKIAAALRKAKGGDKKGKAERRKTYKDDETPKRCTGCGERMFKNGGCVTRWTRAGGIEGWHYFGCGG